MIVLAVGVVESHSITMYGCYAPHTTVY